VLDNLPNRVGRLACVLGKFQYVLFTGQEQRGSSGYQAGYRKEKEFFVFMILIFKGYMFIH
jgi:hypothetical protein